MAAISKTKAKPASKKPPKSSARRQTESPPGKQSKQIIIGDRAAYAGLFGLTPNLEAAVTSALLEGQAAYARSLFGQLHVGDQADLVERLGRTQRRRLFRIIGDDGLTPELLDYLHGPILEDALSVSVDSGDIAKKITELDTSEVVELLEKLEPQRSEEILASMTSAQRIFLEDAMSFPEDSAARIMHREVMAVPADWTVGQLIDFMRTRRVFSGEFYSVFVIDNERQELGQVALSKIIMSKRPTLISDLLDDHLHQIPAEATKAEVAQIFKRYHLVDAAVVDDNKRIIGTINVDDIIDIFDDAAEHELAALGQVSDLNIGSIGDTVRSRVVWLAVNLLTALAASAVIALFEGTIEKLAVLAVLFPVVASMGGNAGTQTVTVAVRAIGLKQLLSMRARSFIRSELHVGLINGFAFAVICSGLALFWTESVPIALVMAAAIMVNMVTAGVFGALIPIGLEKIGVDPAIASSVFITTVTDCVGFFVLLGLAAVFLV